MKTKLYILFTLLILSIVFIHTDATAQGCVAVRNMASSCSVSDPSDSKWQFSVNYRYFRSYKHFRGKEEEEERVENGTEVINNDNSILLGASYNFSNRWSAAVTVPFLFIDRSSLYEHYGNNPNTNPRFHTQATGFGDVRLSAYRSMIPSGHKFNLIVGLGVKLPTGNFRTKDDFHRRDINGNDSTFVKVVDQSIQLGDGGFGVSLELDAAFSFNKLVSVYASGFYLFNPRNTNGIKRSNNLTSGIPLSNEFSVADQYLFRAGARFHVKKFQLSIGGRYEGVAAKDIIGDSDGFRRPGYIISVEPSAVFTFGKNSVGLNLPFALERNRVQNSIDIKRSQIEGEKVIGDAAFADWLLSLTYTYRL